MKVEICNLLRLHQEELLESLLEDDRIVEIGVVSHEPYLNLYVIGNTSDTSIYDFISKKIVDYNFGRRNCADYMYLTLKEFSGREDEVLFLVSRD